MCLCGGGVECMCTFKCLQHSEDGVGYPGVGLTGSCEFYNMGTGKGTHVL